MEQVLVGRDEVKGLESSVLGVHNDGYLVEEVGRSFK
jgi:hypothetical protein